MPVVASAVKLHSVLLATDFSRVSEKPLHHALAIAHCYGAKFCLAHVVSSLGLTIAGADALALSEQAVRRDAAHLEHDLVRSGMLSGLKHQFLIRVGDVWPELESIIQEEKIDLVVIGTHGRHGIGKLLLGSVAEQIFRQADCMVLTVGPGSYQKSPVGKADPNRTFLFATDFGDASLHALPQAVSLSNQFGAKLVLFNVSPSVPIPDRVHLHRPEVWMQLRDNSSAVVRLRLEELTSDITLDLEPGFLAEFRSGSSVSEAILKAAEKLRADLIIMGLGGSTHVGIASHVSSTTAYEVLCRSACPVLTTRC